MNVSKVLRDWYAINKRDLPWRHTRDPYIIWLSEIILQQTRVNQGLPYYHRFVEAFPDVQSLASAPTDQVLKLWQGLGYYSRARNLQTAAKQVVSDFGGRFPTSKADLLLLKGVGEYTAAAVASFSSNEPVAVVDGNVFRFLSRYYGIETPINGPQAKKVFFSLAQDLVPAKNASTHNQAIMEFGALVCKPSSPDCGSCPLVTACYAYQHKLIHKLPVKLKKSAVKSRYFYYLIIKDRSEVLISKRTGKDIWKDLYEFPLVETDSEIPVEKMLSSKQFASLVGTGAAVKKISDVFIHKLSHQTIIARFVELKVVKMKEKGYQKVSWKKIHDFPVSRLMEKYLEMA